MINQEKTKKQVKHEKLIMFLKQLDQETYGGITARKEGLFSEEVAANVHIGDYEVNRAAVLLTDFLNIHSGSAGEHDLYSLLSQYLKNSDKRAEINKIIGWHR
jgi:hypothetical protein